MPVLQYYTLECLFTWHMADGFHWVGARVDDGEHGGDDPEEEAGHHAAEEGNEEDNDKMTFNVTYLMVAM